DTTSLLPKPLTAADLAGWHRTVTSRSAENLFWLGRYTERAENSVRLARLTLEALTGSFIHGASPPVLRTLDDLARRHGLVGSGVPSPEQSLRVFERSLVYALGDAEASHSVAYNLAALRNCAQALRERLSQEHWKLIHEVGEQFQRHYEQIMQSLASEPLADALGVLGRVTTHLAAITGAQTDRMTRDDGWRLLSVGRQLERLDFLANALATGFEHGLHQRDDGFALMLGIFDSTITYRAQFQGRREVPPLLHLLVHDTDNPRSLAWVARTMRDRFLKLSRQEPLWANELSQSLPRPEDWPLELMTAQDEDGRHGALLAALADCSAQAQGLSDALSRRLFSHVGAVDRTVWQ
ncbi:MAG TPA: alpha-E domain-containing protein, partial [Ideonella sp.]|nr:alpha-E domain-containing protein [Ideonella sp.]